MSKREKLEAFVGDWYRDAHGGMFEVIAVDGRDGAVEIQFSDGSIEELDADAWGVRALARVDSPEERSSSLNAEPEDYGMDPEDTQPGSWSNPLDDLDRAD